MVQAKEPKIVGSGADYRLSDVRDPSERPKFGALPHTVGVVFEGGGFRGWRHIPFPE